MIQLGLRAIAVLSWLALLVTVGRIGVLYAATFTMTMGVIPKAWGWSNLRLSLWFTLPAIGMLAAHELGHWWVAKRRGLTTFGPFAVPLHAAWLYALGVHGMPLVGAGGAFLWVRGGSDNDRWDVAFAGILTGALAALMATVIGAWLSVPCPNGAVLARFWQPSIVRWIVGERAWHPLVSASWLGWCLTSASLLPIPPLDGWRLLWAPLDVIQRKRWQSAVVALIVICLWA